MRWLSVIALLCFSCGTASGIWLRVEAPYVVPTACDALRVEVARMGSTETDVLDKTYALRSDKQFPLTLTLSTEDQKNLAGVHLVVTPMLNGGAIQPPQAKDVTLKNGELVEVTFRFTAE